MPPQVPPASPIQIPQMIVKQGNNLPQGIMARGSMGPALGLLPSQELVKRMVTRSAGQYRFCDGHSCNRQPMSSDKHCWLAMLTLSCSGNPAYRERQTFALKYDTSAVICHHYALLCSAPTLLCSAQLNV